MLAMIIANFAIEAQVKTPQASPKATSEQIVGLTTVNLEYSRPSTKGRVIFGDLVPFGKLWRTGANANSIVSFSDDVVIDGKTVAKGKYSIFTVPKADNWEVVLYKTIDNWGNPENEKTVFYAEYRNKGEGAAGKRVSWARQLTEKQMLQYYPL